MRGIFTYLPFGYMWYLKKLSGNPKTVLDLGCGDGKIMSIIADDDWEVTGIDIFSKSLKKAEKTGVYKKLIKGDLVRTAKKLVQQRKKYDLVFCSQVIEHITRKQGEEILSLSDKLAKSRIYFGTPRGFMNQPEVFIGDNPYQYHKSGWSLDDFRERGYRVYGVGFNLSWSEEGLARSKSKVVMTIATIVSYLMSPIVYIMPSFGAGIMAVKDK
ncbi:MAG TPA: class I SAM-dependent methyltransferase [Patescibacteria group bacterium]